MILSTVDLIPLNSSEVISTPEHDSVRFLIALRERTLIILFSLYNVFLGERENIKE